MPRTATTDSIGEIHIPSPRTELDRLHDAGVDLVLQLIAALKDQGWTTRAIDTLQSPDRQKTLRRQYANREWILTRTALRTGAQAVYKFTDRNGAEGLPALANLLGFAVYGDGAKEYK